MRAAVSLLALFLLVAAGAGTAQNDPRPELLRLINAERQRVGAPPLRLSPALTRAAEEHAADLGLGLDRLRGTPLYVFLSAVPEADYFARGTAGIRDLDRARAEVLARVNDARREAGLAPLRSNGHLDQAAQGHAEDMLARRYFAHESPEGKTVRDRARAAGYDWRNIGENLAENQFSVDEVVNNWLRSPGHRRNILNPSFRELGVGVALGRSGPRHRVLWTQAFGTRR